MTFYALPNGINYCTDFSKKDYSVREFSAMNYFLIPKLFPLFCMNY
jgi:hypothetical protein